MRKYFYLQLKRNFKILPFILAVTAAMLVGVFIVVSGVATMTQNSEDKQRFKVAITGDTDDPYTQLGMSVLQNFDDTRFSMEIVEMTTADAEDALKKGSISAYVILPEDFIERAIYGDVDKVVYVTSVASQNAVSMFKNEVTGLITDIVVESQKGTYGIDEAVTQNGINDPYGKYMNELSLEYVNLVFSRSEVLVVEELGISNGITTKEYYICALSVFLILLISISFVTVGIKKDLSLNTLLISKGNSNKRQIFSEFGAHFVALMILIFILLSLGIIVLVILGKHDIIASEIGELPLFLARLVIVVLMISAFNMMIFELSETLVNGAVLHFFISMAMCYVSGCFYPVYSLPVVLQKISSFVPTGIAREFLQGHFTRADSGLQLLGIVVFTVLFLVVTMLVRNLKTIGNRGWHNAKIA